MDSSRMPCSLESFLSRKQERYRKGEQHTKSWLSPALAVTKQCRLQVSIQVWRTWGYIRLDVQHLVTAPLPSADVCFCKSRALCLGWENNCAVRSCSLPAFSVRWSILMQSIATLFNAHKLTFLISQRLFLTPKMFTQALVPLGDFPLYGVCGSWSLHWIVSSKLSVSLICS